MKNYPPEFKADAVALYELRPEATIRSVAADLGINPETLRTWVRAAGASRPRGRRTQEPAQPPTLLQEENAALRKKVRRRGPRRAATLAATARCCNDWLNSPSTRAGPSPRPADQQGFGEA
jgi:transposase